MDESAARTGAHLALIEGKHDEAFDCLVEEIVVFGRDILEENVGDLPPSSSVTGIKFWLAYCMISRPVVVSPVKAILAIRGLGGKRLPGFEAKTVDDVENARWQDIGNQLSKHQNGCRGLFCRLQHDAVARGQCRASFQTAIRIGKFHGMI